MSGEREPWSLEDLGVVATGVVFAVLGSLPWYVARVGDDSLRFRAWDLGLLSVLCVLLSLYAAGRVVWLRYRPLKADVPLAPGAEPLIAVTASMLLMTYRALDMPVVPLASTVQRTWWLIAAMFVVTLQLAFAARAVARTGFRA